MLNLAAYYYRFVLRTYPNPVLSIYVCANAFTGPRRYLLCTATRFRVQKGAHLTMCTLSRKHTRPFLLSSYRSLPVAQEAQVRHGPQGAGASAHDANAGLLDPCRLQLATRPCARTHSLLRHGNIGSCGERRCRALHSGQGPVGRGVGFMPEGGHTSLVATAWMASAGDQRGGTNADDRTQHRRVHEC
jgi:hypothetical protein